MTNIPEQRHPYRFTEESEQWLNERYQHLAIQQGIGERKEQIVREMSHIMFELIQRTHTNEVTAQ